MNKLTQQEANLVIGEAYRLMGEQISQYGLKHARLGQAIWWCTEHSKLDEDLKEKLFLLIDKDRGTEYDFYHWNDEHEVLRSFYSLYVE